MANYVLCPRITAFVLAIAVGGSAHAAGEACTQQFPNGTTLSSIALAVSTAAPGSVLCLARGGTFTGTQGVSFGASLATAQLPILLCSSTANQCTDGGAANAQISVTGDVGIVFNAAAGFITLRDLDLVGPGGSSAGIVFNSGGGTAASNITIERGSCTGFGVCLLADPDNNTNAPTAIRIGSCAQSWRVRNTTDARGALFGTLTSSTLALDVAQSTGPSLHLDTGTSGNAVGGLLIECSRFADDALSSTDQALLLVSGQVTDLTVRGNVFSSTNCDGATLGVVSAQRGLDSEFVTLNVSENVFQTNCAWEVLCGFCNGSSFFNNVLTRQSGGSPQSALSFVNAAQLAGVVGDNAVFNNTFVDLTGQNFANAFVQWDTAQGLNNAFYNNLSYLSGSDVRLLEGCEQLGSNVGSAVKSNFLYTPNDTNPQATGCTAGTGNSTEFNLDPKLTDVVTRDYRLAQDSPLAGQGTSDGAPPRDFTGATRPTPPSIGAFDVVTCVGSGCNGNNPDGGSTPVDSPGSGGSAGDIGSSGGCSCTTMAPSEFLWLCLMLGWLARRRMLA